MSKFKPGDIGIVVNNTMGWGSEPNGELFIVLKDSTSCHGAITTDSMNHKWRYTSFKSDDCVNIRDIPLLAAVFGVNEL